MADQALLAFVSALEAHFTARLGREHLLSPPDFALARSWFEGRVPLPTVLAAIDAVAARGEHPRTLGYCRREVEGRLALGVAAGPAPTEASGTTVPQPPAARDRLRQALLRLAGAEGLARRLTALGASLDPDDCRAFDRELDALAFSLLDPRQQAEVEAEGARSLARHGLSAEAAPLALARHRVERARALLGLPRLAG